MVSLCVGVSWSVECGVWSEVRPVGARQEILHSSLFTFHFSYCKGTKNYRLVQGFCEFVFDLFGVLKSARNYALCIMHYELCIINYALWIMHWKSVCAIRWEHSQYSLRAFVLFAWKTNIFQTYQMVLWYFGTFDIVHGRLNNRHFRVIVIQ